MANSNDKKIGQISCEKEDTCLELSSPHCSGNCSKDPISCLNFVKKKRRWGSSHRVFSKGNKLHYTKCNAFQITVLLKQDQT